MSIAVQLVAPIKVFVLLPRLPIGYVVELFARAIASHHIQFAVANVTAQNVPDRNQA